MSGLSLSLNTFVRAPVQRVWQAWTQPELFVRWFGPKHITCTDAQIDLRVGGAYAIANQLPDGSTLWIRGVYEEVSPPHRLVFSWRTAAEGPEERVIVTLEEQPTGTRVSVHHARVPTEVLAEGHRMGWQGCLEALVEHFEGSSTRD